jgi:hypothetical protein
MTIEMTAMMQVTTMATRGASSLLAINCRSATKGEMTAEAADQMWFTSTRLDMADVIAQLALSVVI